MQTIRSCDNFLADAWVCALCALRGCAVFFRAQRSIGHSSAAFHPRDGHGTVGAAAARSLLTAPWGVRRYQTIVFMRVVACTALIFAGLVATASLAAGQGMDDPPSGTPPDLSVDDVGGADEGASPLLRVHDSCTL